MAIQEEHKAKSLVKTILELLTEVDYHKLCEFVILFTPLVKLTDNCQDDGILSPFVFPNIVECYEGNANLSDVLSRNCDKIE